MALKDWKKSQTSSGYYKKYRYGVRYVKFKYSPKNKIAPKWSVHYFDSGAGKGWLLGRFKTKLQALKFAKNYMKKH